MAVQANTMQAGDVVILKSGGQPMTIIEVKDADAVCVWMGEEGDLFHESIPTLALEAAEFDDPEEDEDEEEEDKDDEEDESDDEEEAAHDEKHTEKAA